MGLMPFFASPFLPQALRLNKRYWQQLLIVGWIFEDKNFLSFTFSDLWVRKIRKNKSWGSFALEVQELAPNWMPMVYWIVWFLKNK